MAKREYPRNDNEYPEVMSKMDPLIIRVDPLVMVVGSTTYTAKVKIGYKFNGFLVHVSGVGIPIYKEVVDITGYNTGKTTTGEGSDAYKYVQDKARDWMDTLEKSMLDDNKEKNIVDLLRELKYQMHFDLSGHQPSSTIVLSVWMVAPGVAFTFLSRFLESGSPKLRMIKQFSIFGIISSSVMYR